MHAGESGNLTDGIPHRSKCTWWTWDYGSFQPLQAIITVHPETLSAFSLGSRQSSVFETEPYRAFSFR